MPSWGDVEVGDRVTFETVGTITDNGLVMEAMNGKRFSLKSEGFRSWAILKSVEKPVRTFKPGDVVVGRGRSGKDGSGVWTIGEDGWAYGHYMQRWQHYSENHFTSAGYVRLTDGLW